MNEPAFLPKKLWQRLSVSSASLTITLGLTGLCGWLFDSFTLRSFLSDGVTMKANTAIMLIFCGFSLVCINYKKSRFGITILLLSGFICVAIIAEHLFKFNLGIDELIFKDFDTDRLKETPGRTSFITATSLLLMVAASLLAVVKQYKLSQLVCCITFLFIYAALLGHAFGSAEFYWQGKYSGAALHTSLGLFFLNIGILSFQSAQGWLSIFFRDVRGRYAFFYILCYLLFIAPLLIAFYLYMIHYDRFSPAAGVIVLVLLSAFISIPVAYLILNRIVLTDASLIKVNQRLEIALNAAKLGSYDLNLSDGSMYCTPQCKANFGLPATAIFNLEDLYAVILPDYKEYVQDQIGTAIQMNTVYHAEYQIAWSDGSLHWISAFGQPQFNADGQAISIVGVTNNITLQKEEDQRKNTFIGIVSHELKTPLTSLKGYIQVLNIKAKKLALEFEINTLTKVDQQVDKMTTIINGFLDVSRLESGKITLNTTTFDIKELIEEVISESRLIQNSHQIVIDNCVNALVYADRDKIAQVINNLIGNAVKYSSKETSIHIESGVSSDLITVSIKDEGIGIPEQYLTKLFDRFYRVENSNTQNISGFGIGLYLSYEIINRHKGRIWAESNLGKGSTFHFNLPLQLSL